MQKVPKTTRTSRFSRGLVAFIGVAVALHLLMMAIYLGPPNLVKLHAQQVANTYMDPVFRQNWHLFSPMPAISSTKLPVRCQGTDGTWTDWIDPLEELYATHYRSRVSGHGKLLLLYRSIGADLNDQLSERLAKCVTDAAHDGQDRECSLTDFVNDAETPESELAKRFALQVCETNSDGNFLAAQFKVMDFVPVKYSERKTAKARWGSVREVPYPPVSRSGEILEVNPGVEQAADGVTGGAL